MNERVIDQKQMTMTKRQSVSRTRSSRCRSYGHYGCALFCGALILAALSIHSAQGVFALKAEEQAPVYHQPTKSTTSSSSSSSGGGELQPFQLKFVDLAGNVCALINVQNWLVQFVANVTSTEAEIVAMPDFNMTNTNITLFPVLACPTPVDVDEVSLELSLRLEYQSGPPSYVQMALTFKGLSDTKRVTEWYLENLNAVAALDQLTHTHYTYNGTFTSSSSPLHSRDGYGMVCNVNSAFSELDQGIGHASISFGPWQLQPFNLVANQTTPKAQRGHRIEICRFQLDQQDHTLAIAISGAIAVLCVASVVVYYFRSRDKTPYKKILPLPPSSSSA